MTTYYIEDITNQIHAYFFNLKDCKEKLKKLIKNGWPCNELRIVCLKGPYKYEGRHAYYLKFNGNNFYKN